jgi:hypothetical protein
VIPREGVESRALGRHLGRLGDAFQVIPREGVERRHDLLLPIRRIVKTLVIPREGVESGKRDQDNPRKKFVIPREGVESMRAASASKGLGASRDPERGS